MSGNIAAGTTRLRASGPKRGDIPDEDTSSGTWGGGCPHTHPALPPEGLRAGGDAAARSRDGIAHGKAPPRAWDTVPSRQPPCGDQISLHPARLSHRVPRQRRTAGRQKLSRLRWPRAMPGVPRFGDHPSHPSRSSSSAPCSPRSCRRVWHRVTHVEVIPRVESTSPWVSKGFAGSKPSSPPPPADARTAPTPGLCAPTLHRCGGPTSANGGAEGWWALWMAWKGLHADRCHPSVAGHWGAVPIAAASGGTPIRATASG